jgi:hypothetical protein
MEYNIYKITNLNIDKPEFIYVGSTKHCSDRKNDHKKDYYQHPDRLLYKTVRENGGWGNAVMSPIEENLCDNKIQSLILEQYWLEKLQANMNTMLKQTTIEDEKIKENQNIKQNGFKIIKGD